MMVLDKKGDIAILKSMGAQDVTIRNIFLYLGLLLCLLGLAAGFLLATALYVLQKNYGMVAIPEGFVVSAYPISLRVLDLVAVMLVVLLIGLMASLPAAMRARQVSALINRE
jgi:lipoprotein-releasing system permease protein